MISSAYNYYLAQYGGSVAKSYTTHKKSELRSIYNSIVKINKNSPLYKIRESTGAHNYAIDLKEASASIINTASKLSGNGDFDFTTRQVYSSDENIISVAYIGTSGDARSDGGTDVFDITVDSLSSPQVNEGNMLDSHVRNMPEGSYSFDLNIGEYTYEFQFDVNANDTNRSVQEKLARLFNRSNVGIYAEIATDDSEGSALKLTTTASGSAADGGRLFSISFNAPSVKYSHSGNVSVSESGKKAAPNVNIVDVLGINNIMQPPKDAEFTINGKPMTSPSNIFNINQKFQITLNSISSGESVQVGFKKDIDSVIDNISSLSKGYNNLLDISIHQSDLSFEASRLNRELNSMSRAFRSELESSGLKLDDRGHMSVDKALIIQSAMDGSLSETLDGLGIFKDALLRKANSISLNPMGYVDKKLIVYSNPTGNFNKPYFTSIYSGMMFNGYV